MQKLTDVQKEQFDNMIKEGKKPKEIKEHFKNSYGIDIPAWKISNARSQNKSEKKEKKQIKPLGSTYPVFEQKINGIKDILAHIENPPVAYNENALEMANAVIRNTRALALSALKLIEDLERSLQ